MFKRNARNALNQSAGIAPVQKFQNGGPVATVTPFMGRGPTIQLNPAGSRSRRGTSLDGRSFIAPNRATTPGRAAELELARRALEGGLGSLSAGEQAMLGMSTGAKSGGALTQPLADYLGDSALSSFVEGAGEVGGTIFGGVGGGITGLLSADKPDQGTFGGRLAGAVPDMDYLRDLGFEFPTKVYNQQPGPPRPPAAPRGIFQGPPQQIALSPDDIRARLQLERDARAASDRDGMLVTEEETGVFPPSTDTLEDAADNVMREREAAAAELQAAVEAADKREDVGSAEEIFDKAVTEDDKQDTEGQGDTTSDQDAILADQDRRQQSQTDIIEFKTKEEIADVINNGTEEEQQSQLKQLMAEFTQNAPQYDGIDKGLAIAKIGFAMAAGKSPDAIQNIAKAMSDGADMLIKDKSQRDAFNRQVQLSALQYGLGEVSKDRAQQRLDERTFTDFVNSSDKTITYKGVEYKPGRSIRISNADYIANGGKLPPELVTEKVYSTNQAAINARAKATADALRRSIEQKTMTVADQRAYVKDYTSLVKKASEAETAGTLIETVIMNAPNIVGAGPAAKQASANFLAVFGISAPEGWNDQKLGVQDLKAALQSVVPATLGSTQSANSISNRDVDLLIQGFLADGIMNANGDGTFAFVTTTQESFVNSLQNGLRAVRKSQAEALEGMTAIDNQLLELYTPGGRVGSSLTAPLRREGITTPGGTAAEGVTIRSMKQADDGIWDVV